MWVPYHYSQILSFATSEDYSYNQLILSVVIRLALMNEMQWIWVRHGWAETFSVLKRFGSASFFKNWSVVEL